MQHATPCHQLEILLKQYHDAVQIYREAIICLDLDLPRHEFEAPQRRADEARTVFERRCQELDQHVNAHGCQQNSPTLH